MSVPTRIVHHKKRCSLEVGFADGSQFDLPCEYLRVFFAIGGSARSRRGEPMLVGGKRLVNIVAVEPVGRYAVRLRFDDGHDTGLYTWSGLQELAAQHEAWWARYLERLAEHGMSRDSAVTKLSALGAGKHAPPTIDALKAGVHKP